MELVQIYFEKLNKLAINTNFLAFFPPGSGSRSRRANECRSGSTDLEKNVKYLNIYFINKMTTELFCINCTMNQN